MYANATKQRMVFAHATVTLQIAAISLALRAASKLICSIVRAETVCDQRFPLFAVLVQGNTSASSAFRSSFDFLSARARPSALRAP